jgi:membrane fusion protein (multidrug efflux system)
MRETTSDILADVQTTDTGIMRRIARAARGLGAVSLLWAVAACSERVEAGSTEEAPGAGASEGLTRVINVVVTEVTPAAFREEIALTGTVQAARDVVLSAEEAGVVRELMVARGASVQEGQPILRIDDRVLRPQVEQARAQSILAEEQWQRRKRLFEEDRVGSELAYLEARLTAEQAAAQLAVLEERLARTVVRAPFAGVVEERLVEVGAMVAPGSPVARIINVNPVKITAGVPERYATDVRPGALVEVTFDAVEGRTFEGKIGFVGTAVNPRNRTFPVEFSVPNLGGVIKPEMVASVALVRRVVEEALVVPQDAIVRLADGQAVYVVRSEGGEEIVESRAVTIGMSQDNLVTVTSGLSAGDRVVVVGQQQVADGDRVRVVEVR